MTTFHIKQRLSILDKFTITDDAGNDCYQVEGKWGILKSLYLKDMNGSVLAHIKGKWAMKTTFQVFQDGVLNATVRQEFTLGKKKLTVEGPNWIITGNFWDTQYQIGDMDGGFHAHISKEPLALMSTYRIDIEPGQPEILMLAVVLAIDCVVSFERAAYLSV
jgi:uncharacterized protein YxjI